MWALNFDAALRVKRLAIAGGPRAGKTTLARYAASGRYLLSTDSLIGLPEAEQSAAVLTALDGRAEFVVEGCLVARALRKGLAVDAVLWLDGSKLKLTAGQAQQAKAIRTVFNEWQALNKAPVITV